MKILNKKAYYEYKIIDIFDCGIKLLGSEVKSLREGNANLQDAYCFIFNNELFIKGLHISKNKESSYNNHEEKRDRKILLTKKEIRKIVSETKSNQGMTIIPIEIYEKSGKFKIKISLAKGKKLYDKRESIKERDTKREIRNL